MTASTNREDHQYAKPSQGEHTPWPHEVLGIAMIGEFEFTAIGRRVGNDETLTTAYVNLARDVPLYTAAPDMLAALEAVEDAQPGAYECVRAAIAKARRE